MGNLCDRETVLGLRPPELEFRIILCLEGSAISFISPFSEGYPAKFSIYIMCTKMANNPIHPCFLGHEEARKMCMVLEFFHEVMSFLKLISNLLFCDSRETLEKTMPNHGAPIALWPKEVLTFSIATLFGIEIKMLHSFVQRMIWMKTVILIILQMNAQLTLNGLSIMSTTNSIAASRLHTINIFTGLETNWTASFGQDHYEKSRKFVNMLTTKNVWASVTVSMM